MGGFGKQQLVQVTLEGTSFQMYLVVEMLETFIYEINSYRVCICIGKVGPIRRWGGHGLGLVSKGSHH